MYDKIILTSREFIQKEIKERVVTFPPAIDSLIEKNRPLELEKAKTILESFGIDTEKPLISQISRFDPWKDPLGAIEAFKLAKKKIPHLQLALVGLFLARDDPEAMKIFKKIERGTRGTPDIFLFSNPDQIGSLKVDIFVNSFQVVSNVILQKSIREGFNLSITEAMWKGKTVIGGRVGGIKLQIEDGKNGFLVSTPKEAAKRIVQLIKNPQLAERFGKAAKETVREKFLIPRLLRDYLKLFRELV